MEKEQYKELIDKLFRYSLNMVIPNSDATHAIILLRSIFHYAQDYVYVYCGNLKSEVYGNKDLLTEIRCAANRNVKLIFILEEKSETNEIIEIAKEQLNQIHIYKILENIHKPFHFTVSDGKAFRFELDHNGTRALGCANQPKTAMIFVEKFKYLIKNSMNYK